MATDRFTTPMSVEDNQELADRLRGHADTITNAARRDVAADLRLASRVILTLLAEVDSACRVRDIGEG